MLAKFRKQRFRERLRYHQPLAFGPALAFLFMILVWMIIGVEGLQEYLEMTALLFTVFVYLSTGVLVWMAVRHFDWEWLRFVSVLLSAGMTLEIFAALYQTGMLKIGNCAVPPSPWEARYFSVVTFTTLGYGDMAPLRTLRAVAAAEAVLGYVYLGLLVGLLTNYQSASQLNHDGGEG